MIEQILPPQVVAVDTREDILDVELFPAERAALGRAVEKRRREFTTARACAREALARLGLPPAPIASGERGEPCWPEGVLGSITHCAGYRGCALARAEELAGLGIDAEPNGPLPAGVLADVACPQERAMLAELALREPAVHWDRLLFCAKEAIYKVWFPLARSWLGFEDALLTIEAPAGGSATGAFHAQLLVPGPAVDGRPLVATSGHWLARDGLLLAAIALLRDGSRQG
ncbi:MAG TPA: 4'-phosphopantetheinyl transferase superfamily protein [Solirubrobacteraceae bacterium]|nr:4'-phosphopantetheinyl transferase superfamily protein [Solirubrobacteraceae bacterium]